MSDRKYASSTVTWSLPARILISVPVTIVPVALVVQFFAVLASGDGDAAMLIRTVFLGFAGAIMLMLAPRALRSIWAPNPGWRRADAEAAALQRALQDSLAKEQPVPPQPKHAPPPR